jgi:hypothetical protein
MTLASIAVDGVSSVLEHAASGVEALYFAIVIGIFPEDRFRLYWHSRSSYRKISFLR